MQSGGAGTLSEVYPRISGPAPTVTLNKSDTCLILLVLMELKIAQEKVGSFSNPLLSCRFFLYKFSDDMR